MGFKEHNQQVLIEFVRALEASRGAEAALREAARWGLVEEVTRLLDAGVDTDAPDDRLVTPLMLASSGGQRRVVALLLECGANVNARSAEGRTPLMSLTGGLLREATVASIARLLLKAGADPSIRTSGGKTALGYAEEKYGGRVCDLLRSDHS